MENAIGQEVGSYLAGQLTGYLQNKGFAPKDTGLKYDPARGTFVDSQSGLAYDTSNGAMVDANGNPVEVFVPKGVVAGGDENLSPYDYARKYGQAAAYAKFYGGEVRNVAYTSGVDGGYLAG